MISTLRAHFLILFLSGCAADPIPLPFSSSNSSNDQAALASTLTSAYLSFNYSDFYSLSNPNPQTQCAGDANRFYDLYNPSSTGPTLYPMSSSDPTTALTPSFLRNVSVDQTDSNSKASSNHAYACSYGSGLNAPSASSCATFDYRGTGGVPSLLGGTFLIIGGLNSSYNYGGITPTLGHGLSLSCGPTSSSQQNSCPQSIYALGVDVIPASLAGTAVAPSVSSATTPISDWYNLLSDSSLSSGYFGSAAGQSTPPGLAGASAVYNESLNEVMIFGGSIPTASSSPSGPGVPTSDTWIYSIKTQSWNKETGNASIPIALQRLYDKNAVTAVSLQLGKLAGGRTLFGYASVPGMAIAKLSQSSSGSVLDSGSLSGSQVDTTDRILIVGGSGSCLGGVCQDVHRFNPTFGPEYFESLSSSLNPIANYPGSGPDQWIDSSPQQLLNNTYSGSSTQPGSLLVPNFPVIAFSASPSPSPSPSPAAVDFAMTFLMNMSSGSGLGPSSSGTPGTGYLLIGGGFQGYSGNEGNVNQPTGSCPTSLAACGGLSLFTRWYSGSQALPGNEFSSSAFSFSTNYLDPVTGTQNTPGRWLNLTGNGSAIGATQTDLTPWFGGGIMLRGLSQTTNQVVFFGGSDCKNYLTGPSYQCTGKRWPQSSNPGRYFDFGPNPLSSYFSSSNYPAPLTVGLGNPNALPINAGMAAARGTDLVGNPLIVAWGGMSDVNQIDSSSKIYYLYLNGGTPTWNFTTPPQATAPVGAGGGSLVFSHVTGKFYLFGGYHPTNGNNGDTWELSLNPSTSSDCGKPASSTTTCQFTWRLLNSSNGLQCTPNCPQARRSHHMTEVNYNYTNAPFEATSSPSGVVGNGCQASSPCSFGIFMEGGTSDGSSQFADRWMFDPTANGGGGLWIQVGDFPPRVLPSLSDVSYTPSNSTTLLHRTLLFGGEVGLQNPNGMAQGSLFFIPPTLGDTWIYDLDASTWNRVSLYGKRYTSIPSLSEPESRVTSLIGEPNTQVFSPPPLSGAITVKRTVLKTNHLASDPSRVLPIPEVYLIGGRLKDGSYQPLNQVYKFCVGTTGEKPFPVPGCESCPNEAICDSYDPETNPNSINPQGGYVGRWLLKTPNTSSALGSFLGGGVYDPVHDLILVFGGLAPQTGTSKVTDQTSRTLTSSVLEYTPPTKRYPTTGSGSPIPSQPELNGSWSSISACTSQAPTPRYGHSLAYDSTRQVLLVTGGYSTTGAPLLYQNLPEVWKAYRVDQALPNGNSALNIPPLVSGNFPCYYWSQITLFGNPAQAPGALAHSASVFIPSSGYNTGYYTTTDSACIGSGVIASSDPSENKLLMGGVYFDLDRSVLGANENLLLSLTFLPLGPSNENPDHTTLDQTEAALFKVHLISTGQSSSVLRQQLQPRALDYLSEQSFPKIVPSLSILSPPTGQIRQEQLVIPLSSNPLVDRIRLERVSGSAILIDAHLNRLSRSQ